MSSVGWEEQIELRIETSQSGRLEFVLGQRTLEMLVGSQLFQIGHSVRCGRRRGRRDLKLRGDSTNLVLIEF